MRVFVDRYPVTQSQRSLSCIAMSRHRVPQNSASSSHQRLFSDLQNVYQKIIQTNGALVPFRAKDSRRSLHTAPASTRSRQYLTVASPHTPSPCNRSVEEIVIKPLQFHDRLTYTPCSNRSHVLSSISSSNTDSNTRSQCDSDSDLCSFSESRLVGARSRLSLSVPEYSEQSIRYVTEQVSLEQARQLKLRSHVKQHRVDRRYFVSGSKVQIQKQAFQELHADMLQLNSDQFAVKASRSRRACVTSMKSGTRKGLAVAGTRRYNHNSCALLASCRGIGLTSADMDVVGTSTVAIPSASDNCKPHSTSCNDVNISYEPVSLGKHPILLDAPARLIEPEGTELHH